MPETPTAASDWKRPTAVASMPLGGFIVELPSGNTARIRRSVNFFTMVKENRLPNPLGDIVNKMMTNKENGKPDQADIEFDNNALVTMLEFIDLLLVDCFMEPKFTIPPRDDNGIIPEDWEMPEGSIGPDDLEADDKFFLFTVVLGGTTDLERFRAQQAEAVDVAQNGADVPPTTISVPRTGRSLPGVVSR